MTKQIVHPVFLTSSDPFGQTLIRLPRDHERFKEKFLQKLLAEHPELLPVGHLRRDVGKLLCVGREVPVGEAGTIDNLYLSTGGYPVIVETKLWRNPQARREVLAQTIEYVKEIVRYDFDWFVQQWKVLAKQPAGQAADLLNCLSAISGDEADEEFGDRVNLALLRGDVIAVIVGDGIEPRLQELVSHVCKESVHLRYSLALVELACYQLTVMDKDDLIVVPRIVQEVVPTERAYVRVELAEGLSGQLTVKPIVEPLDLKHRRVNLSEEAFLRDVEKSVGHERREEIKTFYNDLTTSFSLEPEFKAAALMLKVPDPNDEHSGVSVLAIEKQGRIYNTNHMKRQLKRWGVPEEVVDEVASDYWNALHEIDSRFSPEGITHVAPRLFLPFEDLVAKLDAIKAVVGNVVGKIRAEYEKVSESA